MALQNKKIFYINSYNRIDGTNSNFSYLLDIPKNIDFDRVVCLNAVIPKSFYIFQQNKNYFTLQEGEDQIIISIPIGNYSRKSLQTTLESLLNLNSPNGWAYTISYANIATSADVGKYIFSVSTNTSQPEFIFTDYCYEQIGFSKNSTNNFIDDSLTSTSVIKLISEDTIYIHSDLCSNGSDDILQEIFTSTGETSFSNIHFENFNTEIYSKILSSKDSNKYYFFLTDENGVELNLNGLNLNITICIYKENSIYEIIKKLVKTLLIKSLKN